MDCLSLRQHQLLIAPQLEMGHLNAPFHAGMLISLILCRQPQLLCSWVQRSCGFQKILVHSRPPRILVLTIFLGPLLCCSLSLGAVGVLILMPFRVENSSVIYLCTVVSCKIHKRIQMKNQELSSPYLNSVSCSLLLRGETLLLGKGILTVLSVDGGLQMLSFFNAELKNTNYWIKI